MNDVRFILADPDENFRHLVAAFIMASGGRVVAETSRGSEVVWLVTCRNPDAVYLDARLGLKELILTIRELKLRHPHMGIVVASDDVTCREAAICAGADAFILKNGDPAERIVAALSMLL
jgi:DNA-binding NarL/FixJ family response regulator